MTRLSFTRMAAWRASEYRERQRQRRRDNLMGIAWLLAVVGAILLAANMMLQSIHIDGKVSGMKSPMSYQHLERSGGHWV